MRPFPDGRHIVLYRDEARNVEAIRAFSRARRRGLPALERVLGAGRRRSSIRTGCGRRRRWPSCSTTCAAPISSRVLERLVTTSFADLLDEWFESDIVKAALVHSRRRRRPARRRHGLSVGQPGRRLDGRHGRRRQHRRHRARRHGLDHAGAAGVRRGARGRRPDGGRGARVLVEGGRAVGVDSPDGSIVRATAVVSNADPKRTFLGLVDAGRPAGRLPGVRRAPVDPRVLPEVPRRDARAARLLALPRAGLRPARRSRASGSTRRSRTTSRPGATRRAASHRARR